MGTSPITEKTPPSIPCKVEDFIPYKQGDVKYYMAKPLGIGEDSTVIVPDFIRKQFDLRYEVVTGERKGEIFIINPEMFNSCYIFQFEDGKFEMIPDFAMMAQISSFKDRFIKECLDFAIRVDTLHIVCDVNWEREQEYKDYFKSLGYPSEVSLNDYIIGIPNPKYVPTSHDKSVTVDYAEDKRINVYFKLGDWVRYAQGHKISKRIFANSENK